MYQYKYVKYGTGGGFWIDNADCGHREIIDRWAAEGWRYAGYIPACFSGRGGRCGSARWRFWCAGRKPPRLRWRRLRRRLRGGVATVDLIFEREIAEDTED